MDTTSISLLNCMRGDQDPQSWERAWERFLLLYTPLVVGCLHKLHLPEKETENLTQEVLLRVVRSISEFERERCGSFRTWLCVVSRSACYDFYRKRIEENCPQALLDGLSDERSQPIREFEEDEFRQAITALAIDELATTFPPESVQIFRELVFDGVPVEEVARRHGKKPAAVYSIRSRALKRLRTILDGLFD